MLWSRYDDFVGIAITDSKHPRPSALTEDCPGEPVKTAMWHSLLDAWVTDNVHPVADLVFPDHAGYRRKPALS
jgi:hypothetical protein